MRLASLISTSTRLTGPAAPRKNRRRIAPDTSTSSPACQDRIVLCTRAFHATQSNVSTRWDERCSAAASRLTIRRAVISESPLGSVRSSGGAATRARNDTSLRASVPVAAGEAGRVAAGAAATESSSDETERVRAVAPWVDDRAGMGFPF